MQAQKIRKKILEDVSEKITIINKKIDTHLKVIKKIPKNDVIRFLNVYSVLFFNEIKHDVLEPDWLGRDRFIISNLDTLPMLFAVLAENQYISWEKASDTLKNIIPILNPPANIVRSFGVEMFTHMPEIGFTYANGLAMTGKTARMDYKVYIMINAKLCHNLLELAHSSVFFKVENLIPIIYDAPNDERRFQLLNDWTSMGWHLEEIDLSNMDSILDGFANISRMRGAIRGIIC